jgi:osmotically-inducible protein OsmY
VKWVDPSGLTLNESVRDYARRGGPRPHITDEDILHAVVDTFLVDPRLQTSKPVVAVRDGAVALSGLVFDLRARSAAEADAANTVGVISVNNNLTVEPGGAVNDRTLASKVVEAMRWEPILSKRAIGVSVQNATVLLNGVVSSTLERERAATIASAQPGVRSVTNAIEVVVPPVRRTDAELASEIRSRLAQTAYALPDRVVVEVTKGVVTLSGTVDSWPEWRAAIQAAVQSGAQSIVNQLGIAMPPR